MTTSEYDELVKRTLNHAEHARHLGAARTTLRDCAAAITRLTSPTAGE